MRIEESIVYGLLSNPDYARKVIPHLDASYFHEKQDAVVIGEIVKYFDKYNKTPTPEILEVELDTKNGLLEEEVSEAKKLVQISSPKMLSEEWLTDKTEEFCKQKAVYNAIVRSINVMDGKDKDISPDGIPSLLQDALSVGFDHDIGHNYFDNWEARFEYYNQDEAKLQFHIDYLNKVTGGGLPRKTLSALLAPTGVGKSLFMCDCAAQNLKLGKNVVYFTLEMSEYKISERIDANLFDLHIKEVSGLPMAMFRDKIQEARDKATGNLIVKEYPTSSAHAGHFRAFLQELKTKKGFVPDVIYVDYINLMASQRFRGGDNSYGRIKAIAEELRGLMVEMDAVGFTATQPTREGMVSSDLDLTNTSESIGLPATLDLYLAMTQTEELLEIGQVQFKQLKNRYGDVNTYKRFQVGVNKPKMKFYDLEESAQKGVADAGMPEKDHMSWPTGKPETKPNFDGFKF